jgi:hypothetical protein
VLDAHQIGARGTPYQSRGFFASWANSTGCHSV